MTAASGTARRLRPRAASFAAALGVALSSAACLVAPNPKFIDSGGTGETHGDGETNDVGQTETGDDACAVGLLDCDDEPGCETDPNDPATCGSCDKRCELGGDLVECVAGQCTGTVVFDGPDDTYVASDQPEQNYGIEPVLRVSELHLTYIELPGLGEIPNDATIESVALHLEATLTSGAVDLYRVEAPWDELTLTYANAPAIDGGVLTSFTPAPGENVVELVDLLGAWQNGTPKHSIALRPSLSGPPDAGPVQFSSREGEVAPYLVITLSW